MSDIMDLPSDIYSDFLPDIHSDILFGSDICYILFDVHVGILFGISLELDILSDIHSGILSNILSHFLFDIKFDILFVVDSANSICHEY